MQTKPHKVDILGISVHPDDIELACSGTMLAHRAMGLSIAIVDMTRGELGSRGSASLRTIEAARSAEILGLSFRYNLDMADGFFEHSQENLIKVVRAIRSAQPTVLLANALSDRHPDHGRAAKLVADATFLAGLIRIETLDDEGLPQAPWRPSALYHYIQDHLLTPDFVFDITPFMDQKMASIMAFSSQFFMGDAEENEAPKTPISSPGFMEYVKAKDRAFGRIANFEFAEGFNVARTPGLKNLLDLV